MKSSRKLLTRQEVQDYLGVDRIEVFHYLKQGKLHRFSPRQGSNPGLFSLEEVKRIAEKKYPDNMIQIQLAEVQKLDWNGLTISATSTIGELAEQIWKKFDSEEGAYGLAKRLMWFDVQVDGELENVLNLLNATGDPEERDLAICWLDRKGYGNKALVQLLD